MGKTTKLTAPRADSFNLENAKLVIHADLLASIEEDTISGKAFSACKAMLVAAPLANSVEFAQFLAAMTEEFKGFPDKAALRKTLLVNCRYVAHGGTKGKLVVAGKGRPELLSILNANTSIRKLRVALADAKPNGLKPAPKAETSAAAAKSAKPVKATPKVIDGGFVLPAESANEAVLKILGLYSTLLPISQGDVLHAVENLRIAIEKAMKPTKATAPKATAPKATAPKATAPKAKTAKQIKDEKDAARDAEIARLIKKAA